MRDNVTDINIYSSCSLSLSLSLCPRVNEATGLMTLSSIMFCLKMNLLEANSTDRIGNQPLGDTPRVGGMLPF